MALAPWVPVDSFPTQYREGLGAFRRVYCVPDTSEVDRPVFPDAVIAGLVWSKKIPDCDFPVNPGRFDNIVLLSMRYFKEVDAWYLAHLREFTRFEIEDGTIFIKGQRSNFDRNRDYGMLPSVLVKPADAYSVWRAGGYQTVIEFIHPAL